MIRKSDQLERIFSGPLFLAAKATISAPADSMEQQTSAPILTSVASRPALPRQIEIRFHRLEIHREIVPP